MWRASLRITTVQIPHRLSRRWAVWTSTAGYVPSVSGQTTFSRWLSDWWLIVRRDRLVIDYQTWQIGDWLSDVTDWWLIIKHDRLVIDCQTWQISDWLSVMTDWWLIVRPGMTDCHDWCLVWYVLNDWRYMVWLVTLSCGRIQDEGRRTRQRQSTVANSGTRNLLSHGMGTFHWFLVLGKLKKKKKKKKHFDGLSPTYFKTPPLPPLNVDYVFFSPLFYRSFSIFRHIFLH